MFILRTKTKDGIQTFPFGTEEGVNKGAEWVMLTTAAGFIADVDDIDSKNGKVLKKWDHSTKFGSSSLHYTIKCGAYKDTVTATIGTEMDCLALAEQCNEKCEGWWSRSAHVEHLVGPLWQVVYTTPYLD